PIARAHRAAKIDCQETSILLRRSRSKPKSPPGRCLKSGPNRVMTGHGDQETVRHSSIRRRPCSKEAVRPIHDSIATPRKEFHRRGFFGAALAVRASWAEDIDRRIARVPQNIRACYKQRNRAPLRK